MIEDKIADLIRKYRAQLLYPQYGEKPFKPDELARQIAALQPRVDGELELTDKEIGSIYGLDNVANWLPVTWEMPRRVSQAAVRKCQPIIRQQVAREILKLTEEIFEMACHGDYSNGNDAFGSDEGRYLAGNRLKELEEQLQALKSRYVKEEG